MRLFVAKFREELCKRAALWGGATSFWRRGCGEGEGVREEGERGRGRE